MHLSIYEYIHTESWMSTHIHIYIQMHVYIHGDSCIPDTDIQRDTHTFLPSYIDILIHTYTCTYINKYI